MIKTGARPRIRLSLGTRNGEHGYRKVFPFRRSWVAIGIVGALAAVFFIPALSTFEQSRELWQQPEDIFRLSMALFTTFWLIGWSIAPVALLLVLAVLLFGREEVRARPGELEVFFGLPCLGVSVIYSANVIRNLRIEHPEKRSGTSWRGAHAAFDYGNGQGAFGSDVEEGSLPIIRERIETVTGVTLRSGDAPPEEMSHGQEHASSPRIAFAKVSASTEQAKASLGSPSSLMLIGANLLPLVGAVFWSWDLGMVMLLYWAESAIIGFFNVCKIVVIGRWAAAFAGPFFIGHFGGFMAAHFLFLYTLFLRGSGNEPNLDASLPVVLGLFSDIWPALLAMFVSHGYSFLHNFLGHKEYRGRTIGGQMKEPYSRILFMHLVIIFGGGLSMALGEPAPVIMGVIVIKTVVDLRAHLKEHAAGED